MTSHSDDYNDEDGSRLNYNLRPLLAQPATMTLARFNVLLEGPLQHPLPMFMIARLTNALYYVVTATGPAGTTALEDWCRAREERDAGE